MATVTKQPAPLSSAYHWRRLSEDNPDSAESLEFLMIHNELFIALQLSVANSKYRALNSLNQEICHVALEGHSDSIARFLCDNIFDIVFHVKDNKDQEIMTIVHPFNCCGECVCCADGCARCPFYILDNRVGEVGMIRPMSYCSYPAFGIFDKEDTLLYGIRSLQCPAQNACCPADVDFVVFKATDDVEVARITKTRGGASKGFFESYCLQMGHVRDVRHRALLLSATIIIDHFVYDVNRP